MEGLGIRNFDQKVSEKVIKKRLEGYFKAIPNAEVIRWTLRLPQNSEVPLIQHINEIIERNVAEKWGEFTAEERLDWGMNLFRTERFEELAATFEEEEIALDRPRAALLRAQLAVAQEEWDTAFTITGPFVADSPNSRYFRANLFWQQN
ncbi:MAG: hypothetical protein AAF570_24550, partial [Bacteroidota bacterium]